MAISVLKSGVYAQVTLASLPSLDNNYLPYVIKDADFPHDNSYLYDVLNTTYSTGEMPHKTFDMVTIKEGQDYLNIPLSLTECKHYNYVCMKNSEMVYYYWIVDYQCMNAEVTRIHLLEDSVQTWIPYVTNYRGQLARSHFRRAIKPPTGSITFTNFDNLMINPDMYSVDDQASDIDYLHCLCHTSYAGSDTIEEESYCLVILNPPLSNWFTYQSATTKWWNTSQNYTSYEVAVNQLDKEYSTDSGMLSLITGFSAWASSNLTGYETLTVVDSETADSKSLTFLAFNTTEGNTPMNTSSYGGYDQYVYLAVKYNLLTNFFQSFPQLADYIVEIVQLPKGFDISRSSDKWVQGFKRITCTRTDGSNSFSSTSSVSTILSDSVLHGFFYLITDISALRFDINVGDYTFSSTSYDVPELALRTDNCCMRQAESNKISEIMDGDAEEYGAYPFVGTNAITDYPILSPKSPYNELKLDLYPYKYWTYEFYGGIPVDVYYNNLMFTESYASLLFLIAFLGGKSIVSDFNFSLDVSSVPTWSVNYLDDIKTFSGIGYSNEESDEESDEEALISLRDCAYWQSDDIVATTYAYSYDSWSEYANYSKALTESNLKYKEQSAYISVGSTIASGVINTAVSAATLGLGGAVSTTMSAKNIASSATGVVGNVANTMNALAQQRAKVANNASQLARRTPTDKGSKSNRSSYYNKVIPLDDNYNSSSATRGYGPAYPGVVLTVNYASKAQQETLFRNCDLYGYIAPYYVSSMERGSSEFYALFYSRTYRNYVQWESVNLRFDSDAPKPTYDEVEDLKARLVNGVNFVHIPTDGLLGLASYDVVEGYDELMTGFPEYENLDTLANTDSGFQEKPYFYPQGDFADIS